MEDREGFFCFVVCAILLIGVICVAEWYLDGDCERCLNLRNQLKEHKEGIRRSEAFEESYDRQTKFYADVDAIRVWHDGKRIEIRQRGIWRFLDCRELGDNSQGTLYAIE